jgi:hypothetical protein
MTAVLEKGKQAMAEACAALRQAFAAKPYAAAR